MTDMKDWPHDTPIQRIQTEWRDGHGQSWGAGYTVGVDGITRIEATEKCGEYAHIPYVRVWAGDSPVAEFCQHKLIGLFYRADGWLPDIPPPPSHD